MLNHVAAYRRVQWRTGHIPSFIRLETFADSRSNSRDISIPAELIPSSYRDPDEEVDHHARDEVQSPQPKNLSISQEEAEEGQAPDVVDAFFDELSVKFHNMCPDPSADPGLARKIVDCVGRGIGDVRTSSDSVLRVRSRYGSCMYVNTRALAV